MLIKTASLPVCFSGKYRATQRGRWIDTCSCGQVEAGVLIPGDSHACNLGAVAITDINHIHPKGVVDGCRLFKRACNKVVNAQPVSSYLNSNVHRAAHFVAAS